MARRWHLPEQLNPFQQVLVDYMRAHWPMTMTELAEQLDLPPTTVYGWFDAGRIPHATTLKVVAQHTDIPLAVLYHAVGYDVPVPPPQPASVSPPEAVVSALMADFLEWARDWPGLDGAARHGLIEHMRAWQRGKYDQFAAEREAEQHVVEAQPAPLTNSQADATSQREQATNTQHGASDRTPEQATRVARRRRKDVAHTARRAAGASVREV